MRTVASVLLVAALAAPASPQDPDLKGVLDRMSALTAGIAALEWRCDTVLEAREYTDRGNFARGRFVRGTGARHEVTIVACSEPEEHRPEAAPNRIVLAWTPDHVSVAFGLIPMEEATAHAPPHILLRARKGDPEHAAVDPLFVMPMLPVLIVMNAPLMTTSLDPSLILGHEPGLSLAGREEFRGRACWRLDSTRKLGALDVLQSWYRPRTAAKSYYVDVETSRLEAIVYRQEIRQARGVGALEAVSRVVARVESGDHAGLPREIETTVRMDGSPASAFRQTVTILPRTPSADSVAGWEARADAPAGSLALAIPPRPAADAPLDGRIEAHARRLYGRTLHLLAWSGGEDADTAPLADVLESMRAIAEADGDGGSALANLHWLLSRRSSRDAANDLLAGVAKISRPRPGPGAYLARALLARGDPAGALALLDRVGAIDDPYLRAQASIDRMRALVATDKPAAAADEFAATARSFATIEEQIHYVRHVAEIGARLRRDAAAARHGPALRDALARLPDEAAFVAARAAWAAWEDPEAERRGWERLLELAPGPHARHLYLRCAWRQLGTAADPDVASLPNGKLGPPGDGARWSAAADDAAKARAAVFATRLAAWPEDDPDPRAPYLAGLATVRAGRGDPWPHFDRALERARSTRAGPVGLRAAARVVAEVAQHANRAGRLDALAPIAQLWLDLMQRSGGFDSSHIRSDDEIPPVLYANEMVDRGRFADAFRMIAGADRTFIGWAVSLRRRLEKTPAAQVGAAVLEKLGPSADTRDVRALAAWLLEYYAYSEATCRAVLDVLAKAPSPDAGVHAMRARLAASLSDHATAVAAAEAALKLEPASEATALYAARLHGLAGAPEKGRAVLAAFESAHAATRHLHFAETYESLGDRDAALKHYEAAEKAGARPCFAMGRLYEKLERWDDAMRCYNRAIDGANDSASWTPEETLPALPPPEGPATPLDGRARVLAKVGENHYIDRLRAMAPDLSRDEDERVRAWIRTIEGPDARAREKAAAALREFGKRASPLVLPLLESKDEHVAYIARVLLSRWAEPR